MAADCPPEFDMPIDEARAPPLVVLVEDDPAVLGSLTFAFEIEGFSVRAHDCAESLLAGEVAPDNACFVIDYRLPGMDGLALLTRLREAGAGQPAILITTPTREISRRAALVHVPIVEKPLLATAIVDEVRSLMANA
jgi:FixJ family two-component response regulator